MNETKPIRIQFAPEFWELADMEGMAANEGLTKEALIEKFQKAAALANAEEHMTHEAAMRAFHKYLGGEGEPEMRPLTAEENAHLQAELGTRKDMKES